MFEVLFTFSKQQTALTDLKALLFDKFCNSFVFINFSIHLLHAGFAVSVSEYEFVYF